MSMSRMSRRSIGFAAAGAAALAAAPAVAKQKRKKKKVVVPPLVHVTAPIVVLEDATPEGGFRSGAAVTLRIPADAAGFLFVNPAEVQVVSASALLGQQNLQITGAIIESSPHFAGRFAGSFQVMSGEEDPETGMIILQTEVIDFLTKVLPNAQASGPEPAMIDTMELADAVILGYAIPADRAADLAQPRAVSSSLTRRAIGLPGAAGLAAAPTAAKRKQLVVPPMVHLSGVPISFELLAGSGGRGLAQNCRIIIGDGGHAVRFSESQDVTMASPMDLLGLGTRAYPTEANGQITDATREPGAGPAWGVTITRLLSGEVDPDTGVITVVGELGDWTSGDPATGSGRGSLGEMPTEMVDATIVSIAMV